MADIVSIVVSVAMALIMIAVSFYLYTIYCHRNNEFILSLRQRHWDKYRI